MLTINHQPAQSLMIKKGGIQATPPKQANGLNQSMIPQDGEEIEKIVKLVILIPENIFGTNNNLF